MHGCKHLSWLLGRGWREGGDYSIRSIASSILREVKFRDTLRGRHRNFHDRRNNCATEDGNDRGGLSRENFGTLQDFVIFEEEERVVIFKKQTWSFLSLFKNLVNTPLETLTLFLFKHRIAYSAMHERAFSLSRNSSWRVNINWGKILYPAAELLSSEKEKN